VVLRARGEWPRGRRAAEQRDELATSQIGHKEILSCGWPKSWVKSRPKLTAARCLLAP
jgi:hypothetical protein